MVGRLRLRNLNPATPRGGRFYAALLVILVALGFVVAMITILARAIDPAP
jgi:hypothetical protein